jgi:hypothetical protein
MALNQKKVEALTSVEGTLYKLAYGDEEKAATINCFGAVLAAREMFDLVREAHDPNISVKDGAKLGGEISRVWSVVSERLTAYLYKISGGKGGAKVRVDGTLLLEEDFRDVGEELISSEFRFKEKWSEQLADYEDEDFDFDTLPLKSYFPRSSMIFFSARSLEAQGARPFLVEWFNQMASKQQTVENIRDIWEGKPVPGILEARRAEDLSSVLVYVIPEGYRVMSPRRAVEHASEGENAINRWFEETARARAYILEHGSRKDLVRLSAMETEAKIYRNLAKNNFGGPFGLGKIKLR